MKDEPDDPKSKRESLPGEPASQPSGDPPAGGAPKRSIKDRLLELIELTDQGMEPERRREMFAEIKAEQLVQEQVLQVYQQEAANEMLVASLDARAESIELLMALSCRPDLTIREGRLLQKMLRQFDRSVAKPPGLKPAPKQRRSGMPLG